MGPGKAIQLFLFFRSAGLVDCFLPRSASNNGQPTIAIDRIKARARIARRQRHYVATSLPEHSFSDDEGDTWKGADMQGRVSNVTVSYLDDLLSMADDDEDERVLRRLQQRALTQSSPLDQSSSVFRAQFELAEPIGLTLVQVNPGLQLSNTDLDLDDGIFGLGQRRRQHGNLESPETPNSGNGDDIPVERQRLNWSNLLASATTTENGGDNTVVTGNGNNLIYKNFKGILVSSVVVDGAAWELGVRPGDIVTSISATLGGALWPTSTLDGVRSSLQGRKYTSKFASMEFSRRFHNSVQQQELKEPQQLETPEMQQQQQEQIFRKENTYQLTLKRPLGIEVKETDDGHVVVTGFNEAVASKLVRRAVQVGDRVLAVDSSLGNTMWPVTTVAGLTSACTSRMPGADITIQFQKPLENVQQNGLADSTIGATDVNPSQKRQDTKDEELSYTGSDEMTRSSVVELVEGNTDKRSLIKRCRNVLQRYSVKSEDKKANIKRNAGVDGFKDKYGLPAIVADKVVDALASARVTLDSMTLSMIMRAYLSCNQPKNALAVFEAATGFRADATCFDIEKSVLTGELEGSNGGFVPNESALNLFTGTALLQAHAMNEDLDSICRVMASLEGRSGVEIGGSESAPWPFTGVYGSIQPDTKCYNIAISAGVRAGGDEGLNMALDWFESMSSPSGSKTNGEVRKPSKNIVSYNTVISGLATAGRYDEAFRVFALMKQYNIRPDKFTYTPLIKACQSDGDIQELLYDMKENNIRFDTVTYNAIVRSLCDKRRWTEASKLVTQMEAQGIVPDSRTYGNLMSALLKADKPMACLTLFESACAASRTSSLTENVYLYTTAITAASVLKDYERAIELLSRMASKGVKPNIKTLTSVMGACIAAGNYDLAVQVYHKIENPDGYAICQGIEAMSRNRQWIEAFELLKKYSTKVMSGKQVMKSFGTILVAALENRDFASAQIVFQHLIARGYIPNKKILQDIVDVLGFRDVRGVVSFETIGERDDEKLDTFRFFLFLMDQLRKRKLPVESNIYSVTLFLGSMLEGKGRTVASLLAQSKVSQGEQQLMTNNKETSTWNSKSKSDTGDAPGGSSNSNMNKAEVMNWVDILDQWDDASIKSLLEQRSNSGNGSQAGLVPFVAVRVSARDRRRVMRAENEVSVAVKSRKSKSGSNLKKETETALL